MFALVVCAFYYMRCNRVEGYTQGTYNCIRESALTHKYGGTGECVKVGNYNNTELYDFYFDKNPSLNEMVKRINSGDYTQGGFNVDEPPLCVKRVKECFYKQPK